MKGILLKIQLTKKPIGRYYEQHYTNKIKILDDMDTFL